MILEIERERRAAVLANAIDRGNYVVVLDGVEATDDEPHRATELREGQLELKKLSLLVGFLSTWRIANLMGVHSGNLVVPIVPAKPDLWMTETFPFEEFFQRVMELEKFALAKAAVAGNPDDKALVEKLERVRRELPQGPYKGWADELAAKVATPNESTITVSGGAGQYVQAKMPPLGLLAVPAERNQPEGGLVVQVMDVLTGTVIRTANHECILVEQVVSTKEGRALTALRLADGGFAQRLTLRTLAATPELIFSDQRELFAD